MVDSSCYAPYNQWQEPHLQDVHDRVVTAQSPERHRDCRDQDAEDSEDHPGDDCDGEVRVGSVAVAPARMEGVEEGARVGDRQEPDQIQTAWIVSDYKSQRMSIVRVKKSGSRSLDLVDSGGLTGSIREQKGQLQWPLAKRRADRKKKHLHAALRLGWLVRAPAASCTTILVNGFHNGPATTGLA